MGVAECTRYGLESLSRFTHLISQQAYDERNPHYHMYCAFEETETQKGEEFE